MIKFKLDSVAYKAASLFASTDAYRPNLRSVMISPKGKYYATDGRRLICITLSHVAHPAEWVNMPTGMLAGMKGNNRRDDQHIGKKTIYDVMYLKKSNVIEVTGEDKFGHPASCKRKAFDFIKNHEDSLAKLFKRKENDKPAQFNGEFRAAYNGEFMGDGGKAAKILTGCSGLKLSFASELDPVFATPGNLKATGLYDCQMAIMPLRLE